MVIKITHTISQPVVDGDSITIGKDTIINETAYDVNGKMRVLLPMEMSQSILMMTRTVSQVSAERMETKPSVTVFLMTWERMERPRLVLKMPTDM
mgnify:FL=1|nr:hypothetical protein [uncultured Anaerostipes sp.]